MRRELKDRYYELVGDIKKTVVGSDDLVESLAYNLITSNEIARITDDSDRRYYPKQVILIIGGTGSGKSFSVKTAARCAGRLFLDIDLSSVSAEGFVGPGLEDVISAAALSSTPEEFRHSVIFFDEVDKAIMPQGKYDIRFDVISELLKLVESEEIMIRNDAGKRTGISTNDIIFIFAGAFDGLEEIIKERLGSAGRKENIFEEAIIEDLEEYGLSRQFLGRMSSILVTKNLTAVDYMKILQDSDESALRKNRRMLDEVFGLKLKISQDALMNISRDCEKKKVGVRGLNSMINNLVENGIKQVMRNDKANTLRIEVNGEKRVTCNINYEIEGG